MLSMTNLESYHLHNSEAHIAIIGLLFSCEVFKYLQTVEIFTLTLI